MLYLWITVCSDPPFIPVIHVLPPDEVIAAEWPYLDCMLHRIIVPGENTCQVLVVIHACAVFERFVSAKQSPAVRVIGFLGGRFGGTLIGLDWLVPFGRLQRGAISPCGLSCQRGIFRQGFVH